MVKNLPANAGEPGFNPWVRKIPGEGNDNPLHYSCLENSMDSGAWWATVHGISESDTTEHTAQHLLLNSGKIRVFQFI